MMTNNVFYDTDLFKLHLDKRGLNSDIKCWIDQENEIVTFPLWSPSGNLVGYQRYTWHNEKLRSNEGRYFTWIGETYRPYAVWGWEYYNRPGPLFIAEGIWDAIRVVNAGYSCFATMTATPHKTFKNWLSLVTGNRERIALCDNDENNAGLSLAKLGHFWYIVPGHDLNDLTPVEVKSFLEGILEQNYAT